MQITNHNIAKVLENIAEILETQDANYYRIRAYTQAARTIRTTKLNIANYVNQERVNHLFSSNSCFSKSVKWLCFASSLSPIKVFKNH